MEESKPRRFQFSLQALLISIAVCALLLGLWQRYNQSYGPLQDSYTALQVAAMIGDYLEANECTWPKRWEDLHKFYRADAPPGGSFAEVRDSWIIDFNADPLKLARAELHPGEPPFHAIRQRYRRPMTNPHWDPNLRVYWRLRRNAGAEVAAMVIEYMKANQDAWPGNWDDLRKYHDVALKPDGDHYCSFELARACIAVDFKADPAELAAAKPRRGEQPFRVVYQRTGRTGKGYWDPNQRIFEYLTSRN